jgi:hypothetical protein
VAIKDAPQAATEKIILKYAFQLRDIAGFLKYLVHLALSEPIRSEPKIVGEFYRCSKPVKPPIYGLVMRCVDSNAEMEK